MNCSSCGWPRGHDRTCKLQAAGDVRRYAADVEQLPEPCTAIVHYTDGQRVIVGFSSLTGDGVDHVAIPLSAFRELIARANGQPSEAGVEARLRSLEERVNQATGVAAQATAALERFVRAVEAERGTCAECDGTGEIPAELDGKPSACTPCHGTGRAR